ncbi:MAG: hypothetical protein M3461_07520 [Pseudomonadota bacterium]|nr:hypothetical protein [Pseudomonadota bacterium]
MVTITRKLEILEDRTLVIKLPDTLPPGPYEVVVIVREETTTDRTSSDSNAEELMRFAGTIQSFSGIDGLEYQRHIRAEWE